jgi:hypothetical protein
MVHVNRRLAPPSANHGCPPSPTIVSSVCSPTMKEEMAGTVTVGLVVSVAAPALPVAVSASYESRTAPRIARIRRGSVVVMSAVCG